MVFRFGMSKGSLHFTAMQVVEVISQKISKFVAWPTENKMKVMANDNQRILHIITKTNIFSAITSYIYLAWTSVSNNLFSFNVLSLKGVEGHRIHIFIHLSELVSDIFFSMVIDFKKTFMPL
jgi:hypothetical protein